MRIIASLRRRHKFEGPKGTGTRPTSDLVRVSLFYILGGSVAGQVVVDLFTGTGAVGLEALSRGATRAIVVEQNRANVALTDRNLATLRFEDRALVLATDAYRWARAFETIDDEPMVVLLDPAYREFEVRAGKVNQLLLHLVEELSPDLIVVVESRRPSTRASCPTSRPGTFGVTGERRSRSGPWRRGRARAVTLRCGWTAVMTSPEERREFAIDVVRRLRQRGFQALWAGGCVRDLQLGLTPSDYDVATDATPEQVMEVFRNRPSPSGSRSAWSG